MRGIPMFDDYHAILLFALQFQQLHGFVPKTLLILSAQHNEYKLIFEHLVVALELLATRQIHYSALVLLGNLFMPATLLVYWRASFPDISLARRLLRFAPITLLFLQLNYVETLDWAMSGLQMMPVVFFSVLAIFLLTRQPAKVAEPRDARVFFACLSALLACLSSANAFLLAPVGALFLLTQRRFRATFAWLAVFVLAATLYLYRYVRVGQLTDLPHPTLLQKGLFFFSFLGAAIENMHHFPLPGAADALGLLLFACFVHAAATGYARRRPFASYTALWLLGTAALVTQFRIHGGMDLSLTGRYKTYSDLLLVFSYTYVVDRYDRRRSERGERTSLRAAHSLYAAALGFATLTYLSSGYFGYKYLKRRADLCEQGFRAYQADPQHRSPEVSISGEIITTAEPEFCRNTLNAAIQSGIYNPPLRR
jgi:hypothetical protein